MERRKFLATAATIGAASTAGCLGSGSLDALRYKDRFLAIQQAGSLAADVTTAQNPSDVMREKVNQAANTLQKDGQGTKVYEAAIQEGMEGLFLSNLAVLPTDGVSAAGDMFNTWLEHESVFEGALDTHISDSTLGTEESNSAAIGGRNFLQVTTEAMRKIGKETNNTDPSNPEGNELIGQPDQLDPSTTNSSGAQSSQIININQIEGFSRQVRSPFFMGFNLGELSTTPDEKVIEGDDLWPGQCQSIIKETRGVKVVVRPVRVPIWVEPWFARAQVVGFTLIWVWEFVPAEYLKRIDICNDSGTITQNISTNIHVDRGLMHFWRFMN